MTPLEELRQAHEDYRRAKDEFAVGRDAEVDQVLEYVAASGKEGVRERPMLVAGPLGSGRATVLACAAREAQARGFTVVFHSMRAISAVAGAYIPRNTAGSTRIFSRVRADCLHAASYSPCLLVSCVSLNLE